MGQDNLYMQNNMLQGYCTFLFLRQPFRLYDGTYLKFNIVNDRDKKLHFLPYKITCVCAYRYASQSTEYNSK